MTPEQLAEIRAGKTPTSRPRRTVPILVDGDYRERIDAVQAELLALEAQRRLAEQAVAEGRPSGRRINSPDAGRIQSLREDLAGLVEAAEAKTMYVVVQGLNDTAWLAIVANNPPEKGDDGKPVGAYNTDTIKKPLAKACIIGHREANDVNAEIHPLDEATVDWLLDFASGSQLDQLANAAYLCCQRDNAVPLDRIRALLLPTTGSAAA